MQFIIFIYFLISLWSVNEVLGDIELGFRNFIERDAFGVERSFRVFVRRPELDRYIRKELHKDPSISSLEKAVLMLNEDLKANSLLQKAWTLGHEMKPEYSSDPLKMAAFVYSLSDSSYDPIYRVFNDAVAAFNNSSSYDDFHYKGLYALLLLSVQSYDHDLYRGISATLNAEPNMFMRFNRFQSSSTNLTAALIYAKKRGVPGTLITFKGIKRAAHIDPYSFYPDEDEYLLEPQSQFRVVEVVDSPITDTNPGRRIVLEPAYYPFAFSEMKL